MHKAGKRWMIILLLSVGLMTGCKGQEDEITVLEKVDLEEVHEDTESSMVLEKNEKLEKIYVHICGEVKSPGVYELDSGSRVYEAVQLAGGVTEHAAETYVNLAELLEDGQKVYIPSKEEIEQNDSLQRQENDVVMREVSDNRININTAGKEELMTLTGIGEKRAEAILDYRQKNGMFESTDELMQVEGIKQGTYDKIKDQIKVS